jgi:arginine/lysine/ornithine decarboxylase
MADTQSSAPILEALANYTKQGSVSFGVPGHKSGQGAPADIKKVIGAEAFTADATTQKGIDDRRETQRTIQRAEHLAAEAWGADVAYLSTNGTSLSNHAAYLSVAAPGDTVLVARNCHKSVTAGLILAGLRPVFLEPDHDESWDIEHGIPVAELERKLAEHPEAKGIFVVSPTYFGVAGNIGALAEACHRRGKPLVVDEAWGPHMTFHPELPQHAIAAGADMSLGSIHKTMAGLQGASIMLLKSRLVSAERFALAYDLFESTSPPVQVLASIDATRWQLALEGEAILGALLARARRARAALAEIPGIRVLGREVLDGDARFALDETKVTLDISGLGVTGYAAEDWLIENGQISMGLSDDVHLLACFTLGNIDSEAEALVVAIRALADWAGTQKGKGRPPGMPRRRDLPTTMEMTPAEAFFGRTEAVPLERAAGRVAAEMVAPYPPGIPRLVPGQRIEEVHVAFLRLGMEAGFFPAGLRDPDMQSLRVVA